MITAVRAQTPLRSDDRYVRGGDDAMRTDGRDRYVSDRREDADFAVLVERSRAEVADGWGA